MLGIITTSTKRLNSYQDKKVSGVSFKIFVELIDFRTFAGACVDYVNLRGFGLNGNLINPQRDKCPTSPNYLYALNRDHSEQYNPITLRY